MSAVCGRKGGEKRPNKSISLYLEHAVVKTLVGVELDGRGDNFRLLVMSVVDDIPFAFVSRQIQIPDTWNHFLPILGGHAVFHVFVSFLRANKVS